MKATVRKQIVYPYNLDYICAAFPPRRGYLTVRKKTNYEMFNIAPGKMWEFVYPPRDGEDGWVTTCQKQYIGPDLIMVDDLVYTTYIKLF